MGRRGRNQVLLKKFRKIFRKNLGIDLGTANTLIHVEDEGIVFNEPTVIAMSDTGKVLDVGKKAWPYLGRTPAGITALRPMAHGVISDFAAVTSFIRSILCRIREKGAVLAPAVIVCVPSNITRTEQHTILEAVRGAGIRRVWLMEEIMAAAVGAGLAVANKPPEMIVDIGGGTTEVAVISDMAYIACETIRIAGDEFTDAVERYLRRRHSFVISSSSAERLKWDAGAVTGYEGGTIEVEIKGKHAVTGMPCTHNIVSAELAGVFDAALVDIVEMIKDVIMQLDIDTMQYVAARGVTLTGGGALLRGLDTYLGQRCNIDFHLARDPLKTVINGAGIALADLAAYRSLFIN